jgi:hypothetical protein
MLQIVLYFQTASDRGGTTVTIAANLWVMRVWKDVNRRKKSEVAFLERGVWIKMIMRHVNNYE